jgi:hypothetical protein
MISYRVILLAFIGVLLIGCASSTPKIDELADTPLFLHPARAYLGSEITDKETSDTFFKLFKRQGVLFYDERAVNFQFTREELLKAKRAARKQKIDILFEVFVDKESNVTSLKLIKKSRYADNQVVAVMKHHLLTKGYFNSHGYRSAFYYGISVSSVIED